ncbi:transposase [Pseudonocardia sp. NPDC046786]|uniref:transposase n=1 Tax=Pseudonocardia sp. NPDC046786 TaxID=3155471 RepID=UPI0033E8DFF7
MSQVRILPGALHRDQRKRCSRSRTTSRRGTIRGTKPAYPRYPPEQRARAVKMVLDHLDEYRSVDAACQAIGPKVGVGVESLRQWTVQAQVDAQQVPGPSTVERQRIKDLEREVRDLSLSFNLCAGGVWCRCWSCGVSSGHGAATA